jgi:hypothetical protein
LFQKNQLFLFFYFVEKMWIKKTVKITINS